MDSEEPKPPGVCSIVWLGVTVFKLWVILERKNRGQIVFHAESVRLREKQKLKAEDASQLADGRRKNEL